MKFNPRTDIPSLTDKVFFVTGGTAGIGKETVRLISQHQPGHIYFSGRNSQSADEVIQETKKVAPSARVSFIQCDLASLDSVKKAAEEFIALSQRLDVLICNAGIMAVPPNLTKDGYEVQFGTNHLGHALLIKLLLPTLLKTAEAPGSGDVRVLSLSSQGYMFHPSGGIVFEGLRTTQDNLIPGVAPFSRYGQSKLANILYASELARRYPQITSVSIHPGIVNTNLTPNATLASRIITHATASWRMITPEEGAYNQVWASTTDKTNLVSGAYYEPVGVATKLSREGGNDKLAKRLWEWTEEALKDY